MSKWIWFILGIAAAAIYLHVGYKWVPVIWEQSWGDAVIVAFGLIALAWYVTRDAILDAFYPGGDMRNDV